MRVGLLLLLSFATVTLQAQIGELDASTFPGADIGAKINAAFASADQLSPGNLRSAIVNLPPHQRYDFATTIRIPNGFQAPYLDDPTLDCHGSTLTYTGATGNAVFVLGGFHGALLNCFIQGHSKDSLILIHGRPFFIMEHDSVQGSEQACIDQINTQDEGGPGFTEDQHFRDLRLFACPWGQKQSIGRGGTNSFDYNWYTEYHLQLVPGHTGLWFAAGTEPQGTHISAIANTDHPGPGPTTILRIDGSFLRGNIDLHGENTGGASTFLDIAGNGYAHYVGSVVVAGVTSPTASNFVNHLPLSPVTTQYGAEPAAHVIDESTGGLGTISRQSRFLFGTQHQRAWLASYGGENDGSVSVIHCPTGKDQIVTTVPLASCAWNIYLPATGGAGFGAGFGEPGPNYKGHNPGFDVEAHTLGLSTPAFDSSRTFTWDPSGNSVESITTNAAPGQPSKATRQLWYDTTTYRQVEGWTCNASGGAVHCTLNGSLGASALLPTLEKQPAGQCGLPNGTLILSLDGHATTCTGGRYVQRW